MMQVWSSNGKEVTCQIKFGEKMKRQLRGNAIGRKEFPNPFGEDKNEYSQRIK
jgi:hypothetical protein